jgi:hypothetical protein
MTLHIGIGCTIMNSLDTAWNACATAQEYLQDDPDDLEPQEMLANIKNARAQLMDALKALRIATAHIYNNEVSQAHKDLTQCDLPDPCNKGSLVNDY